MKRRFDWIQGLAALVICGLFFLGTFFLYSITGKAYIKDYSVGADIETGVITADREILQSLSVDNPITEMTLLFVPQADAEVQVRVTGNDSGTEYCNERVSLSRLQPEGEAVLPLAETVFANKDSRVTVSLTAQENGISVIWLENTDLDFGELSADGARQEGGLALKLTVLREYLTWRRIMPLPYALLCLLLIKLIFAGREAFEKKTGRTFPLPKSEKWWVQTAVYGFLLCCLCLLVAMLVHLGRYSLGGVPLSAARKVKLAALIAALPMQMVFLGLCDWLLEGNAPIERTVPALILVIGFFYMAAITPMSPPDEGYHYQSSYHLSNYLCFQWDEPEMGNSADFDYSGISAHKNTSGAYLRFLEHWSDPAVDGEQISIPYPRGFSYPIDYLPQAVGVTLGRVLNLNFFGVFYLGRLTNLAFFALCVYFSLKRIPRFKMLVALTALLPMTVHQAASYSYDTFINALSFLFLASLVREYFAEGEMTWKDFLWLLIPGALLTPAKAVYSVILLSALLIPARRFGGTKRKWGAITLAFLICLGMLLAVNLKGFCERIKPSDTGYEVISTLSGEPPYSLRFILENPGETLRIFCSTIRREALFWVAGCIGAFLSGLSLQIPTLYVFAFALLLLLSVLWKNAGEQRVTAGQRAMFLGSAAMIVLLTMLALFTGWTEVGKQFIEGIQGRYFLPVVPMIGMAISGNWEARGRQTDLLAWACGLQGTVILHVIFFTVN